MGVGLRLGARAEGCSWLSGHREQQGAGPLAVGEPGSWALTPFSLASQEPQLLGAESSVVSCLLEGPVHLGPGSVLQHCHLQVRPGSGGKQEGRAPGARSRARVCVCVSGYLGLC